MNVTIDIDRAIKWYSIFTELARRYPREDISVITDMTNQYVDGRKKTNEN